MLPAMLLQVQVLFKEYGFQHTNYAFVKYLTEVLVASYHGKPFPVCISRPVSVGCIARSPAAGFVGNTSGATGIILSLACGEPRYECRQWEQLMPGLQANRSAPHSIGIRFEAPGPTQMSLYCWSLTVSFVWSRGCLNYLLLSAFSAVLPLCRCW